MSTTLRRILPALVATVLLAATGLFAASAQAAPGYGTAHIVPNPSSGQVGDSFVVNGDHFTPGDTVNLTFNSQSTSLGTAHVRANGTFTSKTETVPNVNPNDTHTISAVDGHGKHASAGFDVLPGGSGNGGVTVSDPTPAPGSSITVSGSACTPGATVTISLDNGKYPLGTTTADGNGNYSKVVTLPDGVTGSHQITVDGAGCSGVKDITIGGGGLAGTGVAVIGIGALGVVLLAGGGLMLLAGRRRKSVLV